MKSIKTRSFLITLALAASAAVPAMAIEPIPGSITYHGQPATRLQNSPIGTPLTHEFYSRAERYNETYILEADRSLKLVSRQRMSSH